MIYSHEATCKFCRLPLMVEIEEDYIKLGGGMLGDIPTLTKLAACNRCADYENGKRRLRDEADKTARTLSLEIYAKRGTSPLAETSRENLRVLFSKWFNLVCNHLLIETQTDESFIEAVMSKPHCWADAFARYERMCRTLKRAA